MEDSRSCNDVFFLCGGPLEEIIVSRFPELCQVMAAPLMKHMSHPNISSGSLRFLGHAPALLGYGNLIPDALAVLQPYCSPYKGTKGIVKSKAKAVKGYITLDRSVKWKSLNGELKNEIRDLTSATSPSFRIICPLRPLLPAQSSPLHSASHLHPRPKSPLHFPTLQPPSSLPLRSPRPQRQ